MFLYLGLRVPPFLQGKVFHAPLIEVVPLQVDPSFLREERRDRYTHLLFTSQTAVSLFFSYCAQENISLKGLQEKEWIAVGPSTQKQLQMRNILAKVPNVYTQEGIQSLFPGKRGAFVLWPRSFLAREDLLLFFEKEKILYEAPSLYTLKYKSFSEEIPWKEIEGVIFTSSSTVHAFFALNKQAPVSIPCFFQGEPTKKTVKKIYPCWKSFPISTLLGKNHREKVL